MDDYSMYTDMPDEFFNSGDKEDYEEYLEIENILINLEQVEILTTKEITLRRAEELALEYDSNQVDAFLEKAYEEVREFYEP